MASSSQEIDPIILIGKTLMLNKYIVAGANALWIYDYFLTLADEIGYSWPGIKGSFVFVLFILVLATMILVMVIPYWSPGFTKAVCQKTVWFYPFFQMFATLFAQVVITLRIYAITMNNRWIVSCLSFWSLVQFAFGVFIAVHFALLPTLVLPDLPFDEYQFCVFQRSRPIKVAYTVLSLAYDTSAFLIVVHSVRRRGLMRARGVQSLLDTIVKDATGYFLLIFTVHILVIIFEFIAPETIRDLPPLGTVLLVPSMITRLILSLKKAATSPDSVWSNGGPSQIATAIFAQRVFSGTERVRGDDVALRNLPSEGTSGLSRSGDQNI